MSQAHKLHDNIHDIEVSTMDAKTIGEVRTFAVINIHVMLTFVKRVSCFNHRGQKLLDSNVV